MKGVDPIIKIDYLGGNCPVQSEGLIDGKPYYFRARGDGWSIGIGGDPVAAPEWSHEEDYGEWPSAGWMPQWEALSFIASAVRIYAERSE